jgi:hypothetical protein
VDSPKYTVIAIEPNRFLVLDVFGTFILDPADEQATRLIVRQSSNSAIEAMEPFNFIMGRRMMLGIKERVEGSLRPPMFDVVEVALWAAAFVASAVAGIWVLVRREWRQPFVVLVGAVAVLLLLFFGRPPLWVSVLLDVSIFIALVWARRATTQSVHN